MNFKLFIKTNCNGDFLRVVAGVFVTYLSDDDRLNVAWTSLVFDGERQPVGTGACIHRKGNVLSSIFTWDPSPAHNVGSLSTVVS